MNVSTCIITIIFFEEPVPIQCHTPAVLLTIITSTRVTKVRRWLRHLGFGPSGDQFVLLGGLGVLLWLIFGTEVVLQVNNVRKPVSAEMVPMGCFFVIVFCWK